MKKLIYIEDAIGKKVEMIKQHDEWIAVHLQNDECVLFQYDVHTFETTLMPPDVYTAVTLNIMSWDEAHKKLDKQKKQQFMEMFRQVIRSPKTNEDIDAMIEQMEEQRWYILENWKCPTCGKYLTEQDDYKMVDDTVYHMHPEMGYKCIYQPKGDFSNATQ